MCLFYKKLLRVVLCAFILYHSCPCFMHEPGLSLKGYDDTSSATGKVVFGSLKIGNALISDSMNAKPAYYKTGDMVSISFRRIKKIFNFNYLRHVYENSCQVSY